MKNFIQKMFCLGPSLVILASLPVDLAMLSRLGRGATILVPPRPPTAQKSDNFVEPVFYMFKYFSASKIIKAGQTKPLRKPNTPSQKVVAWPIK
jgi:hypothetical protein